MSSQRVPKRLIYCSDGVLEEFSSSDSDDDEKSDKSDTIVPVIDPKTLPWAEWAVYCAKSGVTSSFRVAEYVGGRIADFVGITAPVYQYEIEEYYRMQEEERIRRKAEAEECRTRSKEHQMVESSHPFFISMSNDRTKLNANGQKSQLKPVSQLPPMRVPSGHESKVIEVQCPSDPSVQSTVKQTEKNHVL